jgi:prepilin-type N-terminal cleavage/methylation domain-containing protein
MRVPIVPLTFLCRRSRRSAADAASSTDGFTLIELLIVVAMIAVLATIAFPLMIRARVSANEGSAIASLRTIHSSQAAFGASCGSGHYAASLDDLAHMPAGTNGAFIQPPFVTNGVTQSGYVASVIPADGSTKGAPACNGVDPVSLYVAERHPVSIGVTGVRSFAISTEGTMYMRNDGDEIAGSLAGVVPLP